jgi:glutamyl-tRNA reductase
MLSVVGLSYKTAPVEVRERLTFDESEIPAAVTALRHLPGIDECLVLSTCNRTEVYLATPGDPPVLDVLRTLGGLRGVPLEVLEPAVYVYRDGAARHLLRVTAGLDSQVIGEAQILGQVRRAFEAARTARATGPLLNHTLQAALTTGRRVRRETALGRLAASVPRAALALCQTVLGPLQGRRTVVVGAGKIGGLTVELFTGAGARITAVANRTPQPAQALAARVGAAAVSLDAVGDAAADAELLLACAGASTPVVTRAMLAQAGERRTPLMVVDLAIPRGVAGDVASLPGIILHTLDDLPSASPPQGVTLDDVARAERIIDHAVGRLDHWLAARAAAPLIEALRDRADAIVEAELDRARGRLRGLDAGQREAVRLVLASAVHKLLHHPTVGLRELAARDTRLLEVARDLFRLTDGRPRGGADA